MAEVVDAHPAGLALHGMEPSGDVHWNLPVETLVEMAVVRGEGVYSAHRALVTETGDRTGRSPNDKYIVDEPSQKDSAIGDVDCAVKRTEGSMESMQRTKQHIMILYHSPNP